jgi:hypothetical protein
LEQLLRPGSGFYNGVLFCLLAGKDAHPNSTHDGRTAPPHNSMKGIGGAIVITLLLMVCTSLVIGIAMLLSWLFPLSVFEAAIVFLLTSALIAFIVLPIGQQYHLSAMPEWLYPEDTHPIARSTSVVGRNQLCPCGSGKKFKHCCARPPA